MPADATNLIDQARCIDTCIPPGMQLPVIIALLNQIVTNGAAGGGTQVFAGDYGGVAPLFTPATAAAIAFDTVTGAQWNYYNGQWN